MDPKDSPGGTGPSPELCQFLRPTAHKGLWGEGGSLEQVQKSPERPIDATYSG